jgi:sugar lactone lactonase YvrE
VLAYPGIAPNVLSPQLAVDGEGELWLCGGDSRRVERFSSRERYDLPAEATVADIAFGPGETETVFLLLRPGGRVIELALEDR